MTHTTLGVIGMGTMGRGIAEVAASAGLTTVLVKATSGDVDAGRRAIATTLDRRVKNGRLAAEARDAALSRITFTADLDALSSSGLVIESIVEDLAEKRRLFELIEPRISPQTVLGSNTSSLPLKALAPVLKSPTRFLGVHFFSPVSAMKLVELATLDCTYPEAVERALGFVEAIGKTPVLVADTSGYIVNRLLVPYMLDAMSSLEAGVARAEAIDTAMKLGCGHPMGPLELADAIGLDIVYAMAKTMHIAHKDARYSPPALLRRLVGSGHLGKKSGAGIYDYRVTPRRENPELWPADTTSRLGA
jgi:3-hydroxybutyryl-CoA dehydrogenase